MATIFTIFNAKGGVGKTTLAFNLAFKLSAYGQTLLIDLDPQQSVATWLGNRGKSVV